MKKETLYAWLFGIMGVIGVIIGIDIENGLLAGASVFFGTMAVFYLVIEKHGVNATNSAVGGKNGK